MKADPALAEVPIVIVTGAGVLAEKRAAELAGLTMLRKPVRPRDPVTDGEDGVRRRHVSG